MQLSVLGLMKMNGGSISHDPGVLIMLFADVTTYREETMYVAFAMGALGALLGIWIAWSESPVVVTVLPLLFGIVGSAGGYSLLKMDFSKPHNQEKLHVISLGVGTFC